MKAALLRNHCYHLPSTKTYLFSLLWMNFPTPSYPKPYIHTEVLQKTQQMVFCDPAGPLNAATRFMNIRSVLSSVGMAVLNKDQSSFRITVKVRWRDSTTLAPCCHHHSTAQHTHRHDRVHNFIYHPLSFPQYWARAHSHMLRKALIPVAMSTLVSGVRVMYCCDRYLSSHQRRLHGRPGLPLCCHSKGS